jgi:hypothetical protein
VEGIVTEGHLGRSARTVGALVLVASLLACPPPPMAICVPGPPAPPGGALISTAGPIAPFRLQLSSTVCFIEDDVLSAFATLRGQGVSRTPSVTDLRFDMPRRQVGLTVDVGSLPAGAYLLQVIVDPGVASTTVPVLVASDRTSEPVERRSLSAPCDTPTLTRAGTVFCREPVFSGQQHGWRVERPGASAVSWPQALDVKTAGDVVWALERAPDSGVVLRRRLDVDGGLVETHAGALDATHFRGVSEHRAFVERSHVLADPQAPVLTPMGYDQASAVERFAPDDDVPVSLERRSWCRVLDGTCEPVTFQDFVADDGAHGWFTAPRPFGLTFEPPTEPVDLSAVMRPLGADAGTLVTIPLPTDVSFPAPRPSGGVFGALTFSTDAGLFRGHLAQGAFALERLPLARPVEVTRDWVVSQPSPASLELVRVRP